MDNYGTTTINPRIQTEYVFVPADNTIVRTPKKLSPVSASRGVKSSGAVEQEARQSRPSAQKPLIQGTQHQAESAANLIDKESPVNSSSSNFVTILSRIADVMEDEEDSRPTLDVVRTAIQLIIDTYKELDGCLPLASVAVDEDGSMSIHWRKPGRALQLSIPADAERLNLYHRDANGYAVERDVSPAMLAEWVKWFAYV